MTLDGVKKVKASASENKAVITLTAPVSDEDIQRVIEDAGYKVAKDLEEVVEIEGMT